MSNLIIYFAYKVFLDEVNTSSCLGLFKEVIIDRTLDGEVSKLVMSQLILFYMCTFLANIIDILYSGSTHLPHNKAFFNIPLYTACPPPYSPSLATCS